MADQIKHVPKEEQPGLSIEPDLETQGSKKETEASTDANFQEFLRKNGELLTETSETNNDLVDWTISEMNLPEDEAKSLKQKVEDVMREKGTYNEGINYLNKISVDRFTQAQQETAQQRETDRRDSLTPEERFTEDISKASSPMEVFNILESGVFKEVFNTVRGSQEVFDVSKIEMLMQGIVNADKDVTVSHIPRKFGLRDKAINFIESRIAIAIDIDTLRKFLDKLTNLEEWQRQELSKKLDTIESGQYVDPGTGSIDDTRANKDQYGIIKKANEIKGLKKPRGNKGQPWTDLNNPPKGYSYTNV